MAKGRYKGRYDRRGPCLKKTNKCRAAALSFVLVLSLAVGGTLAYLVAKSGNVENQFEPAYVTCQVNTNTCNTINVTNTGNVDAYIRAAIVVNWVDADDNVRGLAPTLSDYSLTINTSAWHKGSDTEYYYYNQIVAPDGTTSDLVTSITVKGAVPEGYKLSVEVVAEAIQADGDTDNGGVPAYQDGWGITLGGG